MAITATCRMFATVRETVATGIEFAADSVILHTIGTSHTFSASTSPDGEKFSGDEYALTAGARTLDLTALTGINTTVDGSGLRPRWVYMENPSANSMTIAKGASNGCDVFGASWTITLRAGERDCRILSSTGPAVISGTNKNIDLTGTTTDTLKFAIIFG